MAAEGSRINAYWRKPSRLEYDPESVRERIERQRQAYRDAIPDDCPHGRRVRFVSGPGSQLAAGLKCPADNPGCAVRWLSASEIFTQWRDAGALAPANARFS